MRSDRIPRLVFIWILISQAFLLFPHILRTPQLVLPLYVFCLTWRLMIFKGRWRYPSGLVKAFLVLASLVFIVSLDQRVLSIESMVLLLITAFQLKLIEMQDRRDLLISVYLAYFVIATELIFNQGLLSAIYMVISVLLVSTGLIAAHMGLTRLSFFHPLKVSARLMLFSVPIMLVAFLVFPRIGPLWTLPSPAQSGKTGMSSSLSPGSISNLAESDELAFRVQFAGSPPPMQQLYWRGLVLSAFDGNTWTVADQQRFVDDGRALYGDLTEQTSYDYQMIVEANDRHWMFPLDGITQFDAHARLFDDYSLRHIGKIQQREAWQMRSSPQAKKTVRLSVQQQRFNTALPAGQNPKTHALAQQLWQQSDSAEDYLQQILLYFNQQPFVYTLTPPLLGQHANDDFLFNTRRGFCEHYANAFVILARAKGLPSRIVVGYQGGDVNPYEQHVSVRQLDAHAWAEVWLEGQGWVRFDPTYAVAPERIERGSQDTLREDPRFLAQSPLSAVKLANVAWLKNLQYRIDGLNFLWHSKVLSYQGAQQQNVLAALMGKVSLLRIAILIISVLLVSSLLVFAVYYLQHTKPVLSASEKIYQRFLKKLKQKGLSKESNQGAQDFAVIAMQGFPQYADEIDTISQQYIQLRYAKLSEQRHQRLLEQFRANVKQLKIR